jgi:hypothetical protein
VVGPDDGVDETDRGRRPRQNPNLVRHAPIIPESRGQTYILNKINQTAVVLLIVPV